MLAEVLPNPVNGGVKSEGKSVHTFSLARPEFPSLTTRKGPRTAKDYMAHLLPVELVVEIWRAAADLLVEVDRKSVLSMAASCTIGYQAVMPSIYHTLLMTDGRAQLVMRIFDTKADQATGDSILSTPPAQRLCPLVRCLCITVVPEGLTSEHLQRLTRLESIYDSQVMEPFLAAPLAPTLTHFREWSFRWPQALPKTLTHFAVFLPYKHYRKYSPATLKVYVAEHLPAGVTHFAVSLPYSLVSTPNAEAEIQSLLQFVLARNRIVIFTIRLYRHAADTFSYDLVLRAIAGLQAEDHKRVRVWRDMRPGFDPGYIKPLIADALTDCTPWRHGEPVTQEQLTAATMPVVGEIG